MALRDEITASYQKIVLEVRVAGRKVSDVIGVDCSTGFDQANAQATLIVRSRPSWAEEGAAVEVWAGYNGLTIQIFGGSLSGHNWRFFPGTMGLDCRDALARLRYKWKGVDREYVSQDDAAIIRNLLEAYGIPSSEANIESSSWTLGVIEPVVLRAGDDAWSLIQQIDQLAGYRTYTTPQGTIIRRRVSGSPSAGAAWHFQRGVDILTGAQRTRNLDGIINHAIVKGLTYEDVEVFGEASAANAYVPDPPAEVADEVQSNLVETDEKAEEIAQRIVGDFNRRPERLELPVIGNPLIIPGMTVQVTHSDLEAEGALVFVEHIDHHISGATFTSTVRTTGGNLSGYNASAPIAAISVTFFLEGEDTGSGIAQRIIAIVDGSASFDPDGTTLTYVWTITPDAGTATPSSGSTQVLRVVLTGAVTELVIGLTVTDIDGLTGTASATYPIDTSTMLVEDLYSAEGTLMACSSDGQQTWQEQTVPDSATATCLSEIAPTYQVWGADSGHIYASFDKLRTAPLDFDAPHGAVAVTAVWIHETDPTRLWAGFSDGQVWFGLVDTDAKTCSWVRAGTAPASPINELRESYGTFGELRATAGNAEYYSANAGATWTVGLAGTGAWRMAAGFDTNAVAYTGDSSPVKYEGGSTPTFPVLTPVVGGIRGISFGYRAKELYAADDRKPARLFRSDESFATFTQIGSAAGLTRINHVIRSGNEDGIVYMAGGNGVASDGGVIKSIRMDAPWYARKTGTRQVYQVGYGSTHLPEVIIQAGLLFPSYNTTGALDGLWFYHDGAWELRSPGGSNGLPAGASWQGVVTHPEHANTWLMWTLSSAYITSDAGATWQQITIGLPSGAPYGAYTILDMAFLLGSADHWAATGAAFDGATFTYYAYRWRGEGITTTANAWETVVYSGTNQPLVNIVPALAAGTALGVGQSWRNSAGGVLYRIPASGLTLSAVGSATNRSLYIDRMPNNSRAIVGVVTDTIDAATTELGAVYYTDDYASAPTFRLAGVQGLSVAAARDGVYCGSRSDASGVVTTGGVVKITDVATSPSATLVYGGGTSIGRIRSDRQTQTAVAAYCTNGTIYSYDGTIWSAIPWPTGMAISQLAGWVEPLAAGA